MKLNVISGRDMGEILEKFDFKDPPVRIHIRYGYSDGRKTVVPVH